MSDRVWECVECGAEFWGEHPAVCHCGNYKFSEVTGLYPVDKIGPTDVIEIIGKEDPNDATRVLP